MQDFTKKFQNELAIVFVSEMSTFSIINVLGKESHVPLVFSITSFIIFHVFFMSPSKRFNLC